MKKDERIQIRLTKESKQLLEKMAQSESRSLSQMACHIIDTHINLGSSGSPVFSKKTGEIIGIASGRIGTKIPIPNQSENKAIEISANLGICRPVDYLKDLIGNK